jgi:hypothetical protein
MMKMPRKEKEKKDEKKKKKGVLKNGWDLMPKDTLKD